MSDNCIIGDLISRKALLDGLACPDNRMDSPEEIQELADYYAFKRYVQAAPAVDAVPVVRCRECKEYIYPAGVCKHWTRPVPCDGYCNWGAKMDGVMEA